MRWTLIVLAVIVLASAGLYVFSRLRGGAAQADPDALVIAQLREAGADLAKPHLVEFFLYLPTEEAARQAADRLRQRGGEVSVRLGADGTSWLCLVTSRMVPDHAAWRRERASLSAVALELGGQYDGWGTEVVE